MLHMIKHIQSHKNQNSCCYMLLHSLCIPACNNLHTLCNCHNSLPHNLHSTDQHNTLHIQTYKIEEVYPLL